MTLCMWVVSYKLYLWVTDEVGDIGEFNAVWLLHIFPRTESKTKSRSEGLAAR